MKDCFLTRYESQTLSALGGPAGIIGDPQGAQALLNYVLRRRLNQICLPRFLVPNIMISCDAL